MTLPESDKHYVSIVICHYSKVDDFDGLRALHQIETRSQMLHRTMESLEKNTDFPAEVIVIDNGGNPDDSDYLLGLVRRGIINTYVRNKENMYFGVAWNQGGRLSTGDYICFTCNDIEFLPNWLSTTIKPLLDHPEQKLIATPLITPDKLPPKYMRGLLDGYRLNSLAGSNCMLMARETWRNFGELNTNRVASYMWYKAKIVKDRWLIVAPPQDMAIHIAHKGGVNINAPIQVIKTLLNGEVVDYTTTTWSEKRPTKI